jgi:hypothetical protein
MEGEALWAFPAARFMLIWWLYIFGLGFVSFCCFEFKSHALVSVLAILSRLYCFSTYYGHNYDDADNGAWYYISLGPNKCNANGRWSYRQALAMISISYPSPCPYIKKILHLYVIFYIFTGPNLFIQDIRYNLVSITKNIK